MENYDEMNNFNWYYKNLFNWSLITNSTNKNQRIVFIGNKKDDSKYTVVIKKIKIQNNYKHVLKEVYFLACCRKCNYFIKLVDFFLSYDKNYIFLILKDEGVNLMQLINYTNNNQEGFDYTKVDDMIKWVIFQIVCGLYILHKNNLIHHDIKPGNILISSTGVVKIADFGSCDKIGTIGSGTIFYESPNVILNRQATEKDDMWSLGVIMVELYRKRYPFFNYREFDPQSYPRRERFFQLKSIFSKYEINIDNYNVDANNDIHFNSIIYKYLYETDNIQAKLNNIDEIKDPDALDLINNLLKVNPSKRYNAEQVLNSKYLSKYKDVFQQYKFSYNQNDYENLLTNVQNENIFVNNIEVIKQKFIGEDIFE